MENKESLRSLALAALNIEKSIMAAEGEIDELLEKDIILNQYSIQNKVDAYYYTIQKIEKSVEFYKEEMKAIDAIISRLEKAQDWMLSSLQSTALQLDKDHLSGHKYIASLINNPTKVEVLNEELLSTDYKVAKVSVTLDKKKIAEDLKAGIELEGARLIQTKRIKFKVKSELLG